MFDPHRDPATPDDSQSFSGPQLSELDRAELSFFHASEHFLGRDTAEPGNYLEQESVARFIASVKALSERASRALQFGESRIANFKVQYPRVTKDEEENLKIGALFTLTDQSGKTMVCDGDKLYPVKGGAVALLAFGKGQGEEQHVNNIKMVPLYSPQAFDAELFSAHGTTLQNFKERSRRSFLLPELVHFAQFILRQFEPTSRLGSFQLFGNAGASIIQCGGGSLNFEIIPRLGESGRMENEVTIV